MREVENRSMRGFPRRQDMSNSAHVYPSTVVTAVTTRYGDAYLVARTIDGVGATIKTVGLLIGALLAMASLVVGSKGGAGIAFAVVGIAMAGAIATVLFLLGTLASAQGQLLKAALDTAVNSSHFLTDQDRARIMSLPYGSPTAAGAVHEISSSSHGEWRCRCGQKNPASATACLDCGVQYGAA
jgi:hypothetical protein